MSDKSSSEFATREIPAVLFDGPAVLDEIQRIGDYRSPDNISAVLDAVVRILRRERDG